MILSARVPEGREGEVDVSCGQRGRHLRPNARRALRDDGIEEARHIDAALIERAGEVLGEPRFASITRMFGVTPGSAENSALSIPERKRRAWSSSSARRSSERTAITSALGAPATIGG